MADELSGGRYARHALIDWFSQERVAQARIAVIGAGAVGNEVVKNLALLGAGQIDVFDFDRIEAHNLTRSVFFRDTDLGRSKAQVVVERAAQLDPNVSLRAIDGDFWETLSLHALRTYSCAIACVDNFEARMRLNQMCLIAGVDLVNAGLDSRYASIELYPIATNRDAGCYECHLPQSVYQRVAERYSCGWLKKRAFKARKVPTTTITASAAGALAVSQALRLGMREAGASQHPSQRVLLDTISGTSSSVRLPRVEGCIGCASLAERPLLIRARRRLSGALSDALQTDTRSPIEVDLQSSDPIITGYRCAHCGELAESGQYVLQAAGRFDDRITRCPRCRQRSVQVEIRDRFSLHELERDFAGQSLPAKYVLACSKSPLARSGATQLCIELED